MIPVLLLVLVLATPTFQQKTLGAPKSPCPTVFMYEPPGSEPGRWYGVIKLTTDITLQSLLLRIKIDNKADILGNWIGDVSTQNNMDFTIENVDMKISPGQTTSVRFFVQFNPLDKTPRLQVIKLNGREICNVNAPLPLIESYDELKAFNVEVTTKSRRWEDIWPEDVPETKQAPAQLRNGEQNWIDYSKKPFTSSSRVSNNEVVWLKMSPGLEGDTQQRTSRPTQATHTPAKIQAKKAPDYYDENASYEDTRSAKDYFDGRVFIQLDKKP